jgi:hypothetical protein
VRSQSMANVVYSCALDARGNYNCCDSGLAGCMGLQGAPCKHVLLLTIGLVHGRQLDAVSAMSWLKATKGKKPELDDLLLGETLVRYKAAQHGEIDWRPTETLPEDYYAL